MPGLHRGGLAAAVALVALLVAPAVPGAAGGRVLAHDAAPETWAAAVREYWNDAAVYEAASAAALAYAKRQEIDPARQIATLEAILQAAVPGSAHAPSPTVRLAG